MYLCTIKFIKKMNSYIFVFKKQTQITNYIPFCVLFHLSNSHDDIYKKVQFIETHLLNIQTFINLRTFNLINNLKTIKSVVPK